MVVPNNCPTLIEFRVRDLALGWRNRDTGEHHLKIGEAPHIPV